MDRSTLDSLKVAFDSAPSEELAKIIVLGFIEAQTTQGIEQYLPIAANALSIEAYRELTVFLIKQSEASLLSRVSESLDIPRQHSILETLIEHNCTDAARTLYHSIAVKQPAVQTAEFSERLGSPFPSEVPNKPKLSVVEKIDFSDVTHLSDYRAETTDFNDVVGLEAIKKQIHKKIILPFQKPSLYQRFKKKIGGGVLLYGPPGCGKTLLARATAGECNASFYSISVSDVLDMYIGESEQKLHAIFEKARTEAPSVLFFDELEALAGKREHARNNSSANTVSQFLTELDGFAQNNSGVLVLASTNVPWAIDAAFLRPGRFDRMFFVPPPDEPARLAILEHHLQGRPTSDDLSLSGISSRTSGYSGADLANLTEMAADEAIEETLETGHDVLINKSHMIRALDDSRPTTLEWLTTARNYARYANDGGRYNEVLDFLKKHGK